jgi:hypothetical protein
MSAQRSLVAEVLPVCDASEVHHLWVPAPPEVVFVAVKEVTVQEVRLLMPLLALRGLPRLLVRRRRFRPAPSAPVLDEFLKVGFVLLGERPAASGAQPATSRPRFARPRTSSPSPSPGMRKRRWGS